MGPAPHSPPQAIDNHADDTEMFPHMQNMRDGAPTPENVLPDVDPCKSVPRRLPVADDSDDDLVQAIWLSLEVVPDDTDADLVQAIVQSLEEVPDDTDADIVQATVQSLEDVPDDTDADLVQAIVQSLEEVPDDTDADLVQAIVQSLEEVPDDTDADLVQAIVQSLEEVPDADLVQQPILQNVEEEENNRNLHNSSNISLVLSMNNHRPSNMSGINSLNLRRDSSAQHLNEAYDFSQGDFLEINDLIDSPSSAFSSENICMTSRNLEEHLNPEASLHEFETPSRPDTNPETNPRNVDCMLSVAATQGSRQVLIEPPASGSIGSCSNDMHTLCVEETADYATKISMQRKQGSNPSHSTASVVEERSDRIPSKRGTASHGVSQGPSTSQDAEVNGKGKAVSRIAKFKKKFCCFIPFF